MHFLSLSTRSVLRSTRTLSPRMNTSQTLRLRPFSAQSRLLIKEDAHRTAEEIGQHKDEHLEKQKKGEGEWDRNLASQGEENIAADKHGENVEDHDQHMEDLQKETAGKHEKEHSHGKAE